MSEPAGGASCGGEWGIKTKMSKLGHLKSELLWHEPIEQPDVCTQRLPLACPSSCAIAVSQAAWASAGPACLCRRILATCGCHSA